MASWQPGCAGSQRKPWTLPGSPGEKGSPPPLQATRGRGTLTLITVRPGAVPRWCPWLWEPPAGRPLPHYSRERGMLWAPTPTGLRPHAAQLKLDRNLTKGMRCPAGLRLGHQQLGTTPLAGTVGSHEETVVTCCDNSPRMTSAAAPIQTLQARELAAATPARPQEATVLTCTVQNLRHLPHPWAKTGHGVAAWPRGFWEHGFYFILFYFIWLPPWGDANKNMANIYSISLDGGPSSLKGGVRGGKRRSGEGRH